MSSTAAAFVSPFACVLDGPLEPSLGDDVSQDDRFLSQAIDEAERGLGRTHPNPPVGAIVVKRGRVVGKGHHAKAGQPHAEVVALDDAGKKAAGATLYVSLEPCTHFGRTPPCVDRVLAEGIARVVVGVRDPNPKVSGKGLAKLRRQGVEVLLARTGPVAARARALIAPFASAVERGRPWVIVKVAATLDGRVAASTGHARWITGAPARQLVHGLRDRVDAVLVGSGTALADDPSLTVRDLKRRGARNPLRVLVDGSLKTEPGARMLQAHDKDATPGDNALVICSGAASSSRQAAFAAAGKTVLRAGAGPHVDLEEALRGLKERGLTSVLVEPGPGLLGALLSHQLVDELWWFTAPALIGADGSPSAPPLGVQQMGDALRLSANSRLIPVGQDALFVGPLQP